MPVWRDTLMRLRHAWASLGSRRDRIPADIRERLPLTDIQKVTFYKRDELTTDLICCDVEVCGQTCFSTRRPKDGTTSCATWSGCRVSGEIGMKQ